jgi:hypothetical protein
MDLLHVQAPMIHRGELRGLLEGVQQQAAHAMVRGCGFHIEGQRTAFHTRPLYEALKFSDGIVLSVFSIAFLWKTLVL